MVLKRQAACAMLTGSMRPVIYQLFVRHFANFNKGGVPWGSREQNGCGTFNGVTETALRALAEMGVTHVWLTGVLRHATQTPHEGLPADPDCVVKGIAGSPYAVTDYFDVDPDLAECEANRLNEFRALLSRCRRCGLIPLMDFIPNHVSRSYRSVVSPEMSFGAKDNTRCFFARNNAFYYLDGATPERPLMLPLGEYLPERGCCRVTGNNAATWEPSVYDWYETVKLNYGCDYRHGAEEANALPGIMAPDAAVPRTWLIMDAVLAYWQQLGVGGFRCDMAHLIPPPFWRWAIARCRLRDEGVFFMAEAYDDHMKLTRGPVQPALLAAGFNGVYDGEAYEKLRGVCDRGVWCNDWDACNKPDSPRFTGGVRYVENHDEQRVAAPTAWGGVGSRVLHAALAVQYMATAGPVLVYNGQETGEAAQGPGGYGGDNGRTSIFDYTNLPTLQGWTNGGAYDGGALTAEQQTLRADTAALLRQMQHPALVKGSFYGLNWANRQSPGYGRAAGETVSGHRLYAFLRHHRKSKSTLLVVANLSPEDDCTTAVHIPLNAQEWAGKKAGEYSFIDLLNPSAAPLVADSAQLDTAGLPLVVPAGRALVLEWH